MRGPSKKLCVPTITIFALIVLTVAVVSSRSSEASGSGTEAQSANPRVVALRDAVTVEAAGRGNPWVNFQNGREAPAALKGQARTLLNAAAGAAQPVALASADFDGDGFEDLVAGYSAFGHGALALHRSNPESLSPTLPETSAAISDLRYPSPFRSEVGTTETQISPDFLSTGDFNNDGYKDIVLAARGGNAVSFYVGDGAGNLRAAELLFVPGTVTAMFAANIDWWKGTSDLMIGIQGAAGPQLLVYSDEYATWKATPATIGLPDIASAITAGVVDNRPIPDIVVAAGRHVVIAHPGVGPDGSHRVERAELSTPARAVQVGRFIWDRENRQSIAVLADDGSIRILTNGVLDRRPYSAKEQRAIKSRLVPRTDLEGMVRLKSFMQSLVVRSQAAGWVEAASLPGSPGATQMMGATLSNGITDDLLLVDSVNNKLRVVLGQQDEALRSAGKVATNSAAFEDRPEAITVDVANSPQAALAMKVNFGTRDGLVLMQSGKTDPTIVPAAALATFNVTTTADNTTCVVGNCSLRGATIQSNATAGPNQINVPAGTYTLSLSAGPIQGDAKTFDNEFFFCGGFIEGGGDLDLGNNDVSIIGTGNPIIQAGTTAATTPTNGNGIDRVFGVNDCGVTGLPINVTLNGLTIRNGKSPENDPDNNPGTVNSFFHEGGGIVFWAVNWQTLADTNKLLTLTNVTLTNNFAAGQGGGIKNVNGALTVNTSTVSNNLSYHTKGGGICYDGEAAAAPARTLTVSGSTISGNSALFNPVTNFASNAGEGGGIQSAGGTGVNITNTNINGTNHAALRGGGIAIANSPNVVITGGSISSNTSRGDGGGIWSSARTPSTNAASTVTINGTTISGNAADSDNDGVCQVDNVPANNVPCGKGGGIMNLFGNMTVGNTTPIDITNNTAVNGGGVFNTWTLNTNDNPAGFAMTGGNIGQAGSGNVAKNNGGGIAVDSGGNNATSPKQGTVTLTNVTLTGNTANSDSAGGGDGGGIYYNGNNSNFILNLALNGTTIASNAANLGTGDGMFMTTGVATNSNTISFTGDDSLHLNGGTFTSTSGTLNLAGNFTRDSANTFNHNNGTVNFNGAGAQLINGTATSTTFNTFIVNKSNTLSTGGSVTTTVTNNLTMTTGTFNAPALLDVNGTTTLNGGTLSAGANITEALNWTNNGGTFTPNTGIITFDGAVAQSINGTAASQTFFNFVVNKGAGSTLNTSGSTNSLIVNNLTNTLGNFLAPATLDINGNTTLSAGTFTGGATITAAGNWTHNGGAFAPSAGTVTFDGAAAQSLNGSAASQIFHNFTVNKSNTLTGGGGLLTLNVTGNLSITGGGFAAGTITTLNLTGNWTNTSAFTADSSTVILIGNNNTQTLSGSTTFNNLTVNHTGTGGVTSVGSTLAVTGLMRVQSGTFTTASSFNNVQIDSGATLASDGTTMNVSGNWTNNGGTFTPNGNTVNFNGNGAQSLGGTSVTQTFNNFTVNKTGGALSVVASTTTLDINGNLTLTAGTFAAGTATSITVAGNWANTGTFTGGSGTVIFDGNGNTQTLSGSTTFNNLTINHTGAGNVDASASTLAVTGLMRVQGGTFISSSTFNNVQIDSGQTLQGTNATTMNVSGNWTNNGGTFTPSGNTVNFNGSGAQSISGTAATQTFDNFTVNKSGGSTLSVAASTTALDINGNVTLTLGTFAAGTATAINVAGNWTNNGGAFTPGASTVTFDGGAGQTIGGTTATTFNNLTNGNANGLAMSHDNTVNGILALTSSDITVANTKTLTQPNTGSSSGTFDVIGSVKRTGFVTFPCPAPPCPNTLSFGNPNNQITITAGAPPTDINVNLVKSAPVGFSGAVQRTYTITPNGGAGITATLRLHYLDSELNSNVEANLNLRRFNGTGWVPYPATAADPTTGNWVENNAVQTFSPWTLSSFTPTASSGTVTGRITSNGGTPVEGAVVRLSGTQNRKFITDANGFYRFDNVETSGFYTVTPSRANYEFSPAARSFSQLGQTTEATFGATPASSGFVNPLDTPEYFVRQHYVDFLGREPDESGFNFWSDQILGCGGDADCVDRKLTNVSAAYFLSIEFQETGGLVDGLYRASYGVRPNFAEFRADAAAVAPTLVVGNDGWEQTLENGKAAFIDAFVQRPAFQAAFGGMSNDAYVDALIANTGVSFTSAERNALVSGLEGAMTRATVLRAIVENPSVVAAKRNEAFVMMEYFGYLRREPDADGYQFWLNKLNQFNGNFEQAEMVRSFIVSGEYRARFPR